MTRGSTTSSRRRRTRIATVAALVTTVAAGGAWSWYGSDRGSDGPLVFPLEYTSIMAELPEPGFSAFDACVEGPSRRIRISDVSARLAIGDGSARVLVGWISPNDPPEWGAGRISNLDPVYQPLNGESAGTVRSCHSGRSGLEFAVLFPPATTSDVLVDQVTVSYTADGTAYTERVDLRLGVCAQQSTVASTMEECARED